MPHKGITGILFLLLRMLRVKWLVPFEKFEEVAVMYFSNLFESHQNTVDVDVIFQNTTIRTLSREDIQCLSRAFTHLEVVEALKGMHPSKSPSLDGMHTSFYQTF